VLPRIQKIKLQSTPEDPQQEMDGQKYRTHNQSSVIMHNRILAQMKTCKGKNKREKAFHEQYIVIHIVKTNDGVISRFCFYL